MAKKTDEKDDNLKKYRERMAEFKPGELIQPKREPSIDDLAAEGAELLTANDIKNMNPLPTPVKNPIQVSSDNPYIQARNQVLAKYPDWKRGEMLKMEKDKNTDNRHYIQFCKDVLELGNHISYDKK